MQTLAAWMNLLRKGRRRVLVIGDSHVRIFRHPLLRLLLPTVRFDVCYVPGASAIGLLNEKSKTRSGTIFRESLEGTTFDHVVVSLGEVDVSHALWLVSDFHKTDVGLFFRRALWTYQTFMLRHCPLDRTIVLGATLPTVERYEKDGDEVHTVRAAVGATWRERIDLARDFNGRMAEWCRLRGIPHLDTGPAALGEDGLVRPAWRVKHRVDHHYARLPFALWLAASLPRVLVDRAA